MHFENDNLLLWFSTSDAPAPTEFVASQMRSGLTIGVSPIDGGNRVEILLRVNEEQIQVVPAKWRRTDSLNNVHYFSAEIGPFQYGDRVQYLPILRCSGRQVPAENDINRLFVNVSVQDDLGDSIYTPQISAPGSNLRPFSPSRSRTRRKLSPPSDGIYFVRGQLIDTEGFPIVGARIQVLDKDIRKESLIGSTLTDEDGFYTIEYTGNQLSYADKPLADLQVHILDEDDKILGSSSLIIDAAPDQVVNLTAQNGHFPSPTEFENVSHALTSLLRYEDVSSLTQADIQFIAAKVNMPIEQIKGYINAVSLNQEFGIPSEIAYGLDELGIPCDEFGLAFHSKDGLMEVLKRKVNRGIIRDEVLDSAAGVLQDMRTKVIARLRDGSFHVNGSKLIGILDTAQLNPNQREFFLNTYAEHRADPLRFRQELTESDSFGKAAVDQTIFASQLGILTGNHIPLMTALGEQYSSMRDLAKLSRDDWKMFVGQQFEGEVGNSWVHESNRNVELATDIYVDAVMRAVEETVPTAVFEQGLRSNLESSESQFPNSESVLEFLETNVEFDFSRMSIASYLGINPQLLDQFEESGALRSQLFTIQRLFNVVPEVNRFDTIHRCIENRITSAFDILRTEQTKLLDLGFDEEFIIRTREVACNAAGTAFLLYLSGGSQSNNADVETIEGPPMWESLFGSLDLCKCEHCQSMYSPAAYLVDILYFLMRIPVDDEETPTALDVLLKRRPDLGQIELNCENTNTQVPYVDLVNEIMENAVAGTNEFYQTKLKSGESHVYPEHINLKAYEILSGLTDSGRYSVVYPWNLPFNLWHQEKQTYLQQINVTSCDLASTFRRDFDGPLSLTVAMERLNLSYLQLEIITKKAWQTGSSLKDYWGLDSDEPILGLRTISTLLDKLKLPYQQLEQLLMVKYISQGEAFFIHFTDPTCDPDHATVRRVEEPSVEIDAQVFEPLLDRVHRFERLRRIIGWTIQQLDAALRINTVNDITYESIISLATMDAIYERLRLRGDRVPMMSWWSTLYTTNYGNEIPSHYKTVFLEESVTGIRAILEESEAIPSDYVFELNEAQNELRYTEHRIRDFSLPIQAALEINSEDLDELLTFLEREAENSLKINLENLSLLYRIVTFAKALELSIHDFLKLVNLSHLNPFVSPQNMNYFLDIVELVHGSRFDLEEIDYVLNHILDPDSNLEIDVNLIAEFLLDLRNELVRIDGEYVETSDPTQIIQALSDLLPEDIADQIIGWLNIIDPLSSDLEDQVRQLRALYENSLYPAIGKEPEAFEEQAPTEPPDWWGHYLKLQAHIQQLLNELVGINGEYVETSDPTQIIQAIRDLLPEEVADQIISLLNLIDPLSGELEDQVKQLRALYESSLYPALGNEPDTFEEQAPNEPPDWRGHFRDLQAHIQRLLLEYLRSITSETMVIQKVADFLNIDITISRSLLSELLPSLNPSHSSPTDAGRDNAGSDDSAESKVFALRDFLYAEEFPSPPDTVSRDDYLPYLANLKNIEEGDTDEANKKSILYKHQHIIRLDKIARLISKLRLSNDELIWCFESGSNFGMLSFDQLPVTVDLSRSVSRFDAWLAMEKYFQWRDDLPVSRLVRNRFYEIFQLLKLDNATDQLQSFIIDLNARTGWREQDLEFLLDTTRFGHETTSIQNGNSIEFPQDFDTTRFVPLLAHLSKCFETIDRLGISAEVIWDWTIHTDHIHDGTLNNAGLLEDYQTTASEIRQAIKAKYNSTVWKDIGAEIRDSLRDQQITALRGYLMTVFKNQCGEDETAECVEDEYYLYTHFLTDVKMGSCRTISRIVLAHSTVQLFVQRCLMNLEENVEIPSESARRWVWMKTYRVWEANLKTFLYPENWIEPELRDDKSPFFIELENELLQDEVTDASAERAFLNYLEKLNEIARPEIAALTYDEEANVTHVIGRTRGLPHRYFYRRWVEDAYWTPWEQIDVDIEGDHQILVAFNRRLYLFWPIIKEGKDDHRFEIMEDADNTSDINLRGPTPVHFSMSVGSSTSSGLLQINTFGLQKPLEVQMAWTEFSHQRWSKKRVSTGYIPITWDPEMDIYRNYLRQDLIIAELVAETKEGEVYYRFKTMPKRLIRFKAEINSNQQLSIYTGFRDPFQSEVVKDCGVFVLRDDGNLVTNIFGVFTQDRVDFVQNTGQHFQHHVSLEDVDQLVVRAPIERVVSADDDQNVQPNTSFGAYGPEFGLVFGIEKVQEVPVTEPLGIGTYETPQYVTLLSSLPDTFSVRLPALPESSYFASQAPFFFDDPSHTFFIRPRDRSFLHSGYIEDILVWDEHIIPCGPLFVGGFPGSGPFPVDYVYNADRYPTSQPFHAGYSQGSRPTFGIPIKNMRSSEPYIPIVPGLGDYGQVGGHIDFAESVFKVKESTIKTRRHFRFDVFYHPYMDLFLRQLNRHGIDGLLNPDPALELGSSEMKAEIRFFQRQQNTRPDIFTRAKDPTKNAFDEPYPVGNIEFTKAKYTPTNVVDEPYPVDNIDFTYCGAYAGYNWELFFHVPFLIANRLSSNQRFEEAMKWYHYIFDPTDSKRIAGIPTRFWKTKPLALSPKADPIHALLLKLMDKESNTGDSLDEAYCDLPNQITQWRNNPFRPHATARLRHVAYQKAIVMKYIDNLIMWGDHLFRQFTVESINEATQLYLLAADILGKRPRELPIPEGDRILHTPSVMKDSETRIELRTFDEMRSNLASFDSDVIPNPLVDIEAYLPPQLLQETSPTRTSTAAPLPFGPTFFFCIPRNEELLEYWTKVEDRLFKIRHCMDIEGIQRDLALFEPPIDPALLVRAVAAGLDLSQVISDILSYRNAPKPHYKFRIILQKAIEMCADVRSLGGALLSALEKKDAESLSILRAQHEEQILKATKEIKKKQVDEAEEAVTAQEEAKAIAEFRKQYYESREFLNASEKQQLSTLEKAFIFQSISQGIEVLASVFFAIPQAKTGVEQSATTTATSEAEFGGQQMGNIARAFSGMFSLMASALNHQANMAGIKGGHSRRQDDWTFQAEMASKEIDQIETQIIAAQIRLTIAEQDLANHEQQIENAGEVYDHLRDKFTDEALYGWMTSQLSTLYFQSYQLAFDLAKRAERAYQYEIGDDSATFIDYGYWDSLKKGLLAGEKLHFHLKRMETAFYDNNKREAERKIRIPLSFINAKALVMLRETGECHFEIPEFLFDLRTSGFYMRRIKAVGLTIPSVTGPFSSVDCKLTLLTNYVRHSTNSSESYGRIDNDSRFYVDTGGNYIVTSTANQDFGVFELNLNDERNLQFEGAGAISSWHMELPGVTRSNGQQRGIQEVFRQFDYRTIPDVIIEMWYTERNGGEIFKSNVEGHLINTLTSFAESEQGLYQYLSVKQDFNQQWNQFRNLRRIADDSGEDNPKFGHVLEINLQKETHFPSLFDNKTIEFQELKMVVNLNPSVVPRDINDLMSIESPIQILLNKEEVYVEVSETEQERLTLLIDDTLSASLTVLLSQPQQNTNLNSTYPKLNLIPSIGDWSFIFDQESIGSLPDKWILQDSEDEPIRINPDVIQDIGFLIQYTVLSES